MENHVFISTMRIVNTTVLVHTFMYSKNGVLLAKKSLMKLRNFACTSLRKCNNTIGKEIKYDSEERHGCSHSYDVKITNFHFEKRTRHQNPSAILVLCP